MLFFLGNSHANNGIAPVELWNQYGYTAYNFSMMSQTFPLVYYNAVDAIKMQHPDILVVDLFVATSFSNNFPNMHKSIDNLTLTTRLTAISEFIPDDLKMEYYFPMYLYHDRWSNLEKKDESHVNILGALKVTDFLGKFISENYNITDYRDNVKVAKEWNDAYMKYSAQRDGLVAKCKEAQR